MTDEKSEEGGQVVSMFEHEAKKSAGVRLPGTTEDIKAIAQKKNVPVGQSIELRDPDTGKTKVFEPVWFGCLHCMWERHNDEDLDAFEAPQGGSVYRFYREGRERFMCGDCNREVEPYDTKVEMFVDVSVIKETGLQVSLPARLGFVAPGRNKDSEMMSQVYRWWVSSVQAIGTDNGLVPPHAQSEVKDLKGAAFAMSMANPSNEDYGEDYEGPELTDEMLGEFHSQLRGTLDDLGVDVKDTPDEEE